MSDLVSRTGHALAVVQTDLIRDEKILWAAQQEPKMLGAADFFLVPFGLFYFGFSIFWILGASGFLSDPPKLSAFGLFGIPFVLVGFYTAFGRFIVKSWIQRNTYYAVTNHRVLVLCTVPNRSLQAVFINAIPTLNKSVGSNGIGTITFGSMPAHVAMYANSGMDFFASTGGLSLPPAFYDVKDVNSVYELINSQRNIIPESEQREVALLQGKTEEELNKLIEFHLKAGNLNEADNYSLQLMALAEKKKHETSGLD
jgi:apolipoprotein N-acyltransferase